MMAITGRPLTTTTWRRAVPLAARASVLENSGVVGHNPDVGFNPFRPVRRRRTDYVMVAAAFVVVAVLLLWAALPR
jgi:hypothetical protein